jgi:putative restriction endonuclease
LERLGSMRQRHTGGTRAPHKPLLVLYAIARLQSTGSSRIRFVDAEAPLKHLLVEFGPPGTRPTPQYPFVRLANDGLWEIATDDGSTPSENLGDLRASGATGRLSPEFESELKDDPALCAIVARFLLDREWEESLHGDICEAVGLDLESFEVAAAQIRSATLLNERRSRDPAFRQSVLVAYEFRCAMCGYDGWIDGESVGLEAAHVRWWAYDGPDTVGNGLCLCSLHHKLLDRGVIGVSGEHTMAVSKQFVGRSPTARHLVLDLVGRPLREPQAGEMAPETVYVAWHAAQVFKGPGREVAAAPSSALSDRSGE